jgi:tetratricopeptide (TPR) repeat protein
VARPPNGKHDTGPKREAGGDRRAAEAAPIAGPRRPRWLAWAALVAAVVIAAGGYAAYTRVRRADYTSRLPPLPDLSRSPAAMRTHLAQADATAHQYPTSADSVGALGFAYHADMFYAEAERCYRLAEGLAGSEGWRWTYYRALAESERGESAAALAALRTVTASAPQFAPGWWRLGEAEFKAGKNSEAEAAWQRLQSMPEPDQGATTSGGATQAPGAPLSAYATLGLARVALARGDTAGAGTLLERVTKSAPSFGPAYRLLGTVYAALGLSDESAAATRKADRSPGYDPYVDPTFDALVRESRNSTFLLQQASATDVTTNSGWREHLIRLALEYDPDNTDALYELASLLRVLRRFDEALTLLEQYRRAVPDDVQALADTGRCLSGLKRYAEAEGVLRRAVAALDDANARYDLGLVLDRTGRLAEAMTEYQRALTLNPNHRDALNNLGIAYVRLNRLPDAARLFERLVADDPGNADAHTNLGVVFMTQGNRDRAAREFTAALQINPDHAVARDGLTKVGR